MLFFFCCKTICIVTKQMYYGVHILALLCFSTSGSLYNYLNGLFFASGSVQNKEPAR